LFTMTENGEKGKTKRGNGAKEKSGISSGKEGKKKQCV